MNYDTAWIWDIVGAILVVGAFALGATAIAAEHKVDGYYFSRGSGTSTATCVYAHWTWHNDETAFCTNNYQEAIDFAEKANASLKH